MPPLVSVIIPTYNRSGLLAEAIESTLAQTWKDLEIIVVDDGSTDDTREVVARYGGRVRYIFQPNSGRPALARNVGIRRAAGEYIAFLDSDDLVSREKIEMQVRFLRENRRVGMVVTDFSTFADGKTISRSFTSDGHPRFVSWPKTRVGPHEYVLSEGVCDCLAMDNFIGTSSVVVRKDVFDSVGLFDESPEVRSSEDIDMWFRIVERFPLGYVDIPLHAYRIHSDNLSGMNEQVIRARIITRERFLKSPALSAKTRQELVGRLGGMYFSLAYYQLNHGSERAARFNVWESLKRRPIQLAAYKLACVSLVPKKMRQLLRIAYRAVLNRRAEELASSVEA